MDKEKDIRILSNSRNKPTSFTVVDADSKLNIEYISDTNKGRSFLYKKTSGILQAVFLITDNIEDSNVLKTSLRSESVSLLSLIVDMGGGLKDRQSGAALAILLKLKALLSAAHAVSIVKGEYVLLLQGALSDLEGAFMPSISAESFNEVLFSKEETNVVVKESERSSRKKDDQDNKGQAQNFAYQKQSISQPIIQRQTDRREAILNLIKDRHRVTVKDAQEIIAGVSSKTLQRELLAMVAEGVLKKEGERRWSAYMLRTNGNGNGNGTGNGLVSSSVVQ